jgi:3''-phosphoadenosine 5''-phosphosulfate sulfotransferase (PAPS reductase)/FAD synthetase and related enzymes
MDSPGGVQGRRKIHCFFSGGRDSAVACVLAKRVADVRGWGFVLVHLDTTVAVSETQEYVRRYAEWLGAELVIVRPERTFAEYAERYGMWPSLFPHRFRWCMRRLKIEPSVRYLQESYREGDFVVLGIRGRESKFRERLDYRTFADHRYGGKVTVRLWLPLLRADEASVRALAERFGIPQSPVWRKLGISGECLCLAGTPVHRVVLIARHYPEEFKRLLEIDEVINRNRKSKERSSPFRLAQYGLSLQDIQRRAATLVTLDDFVYGKSCEGSCML